MNYRDRWTDEHGADGLRPKFAVYKVSAREPMARGTVDAFPSYERIGEDGEFVFVLRPESDRAAAVALAYYAEAAMSRSPQLTADITAKLLRICDVNGI